MSGGVADRFAKISRDFIRLSDRERMLIFVAGLVIILLGGFVLFIEPALVDIDKQRAESQRQEREVQRLESQLAALQVELQEDPDAPLKARLNRINEKISELDGQLAAQTEDLVPAHRMPKLLERVLSRSSKLTLLEMESIAPKQMLQLEEGTDSATNLYQHGVRLILEGSYFEIQKYLQEVEDMPWRFYWKRFAYQVTDYPLAEVEIELYTLSTSQAFIGVWKDD